MKPSDFLVLVRNEIQDHGWCRSVIQDKQTGAVSIDGAIKLANRHIQLHKLCHRRKITQELWAEFYEASNAASTAVDTLTDLAKRTGSETIVIFNDLVAQSKKDALKFLDQGITLLKEQDA